MKRKHLYLPPLLLSLTFLFGDGEARLDLTREALPHNQPERVWVSFPASRQAPASWLEATLTHLSVSTLEPGQPFFFEIKLRNRGSRDLLLPWTPDWQSVRGGMQEPADDYLEACLYLVILGKSGQRLSLPGVNLYGRRAHPGSIHRLEAGQSVFIRVPTRFDVRKEKQLEKLLDGSGGTLKLAAVFTFLFRSEEPQIRPATSPPLSVEVSSPQP